MNFLALATDYDGTLARDGVAPQSTVAALEKLRASGRKLLLVTGRLLEDMLEVFPSYSLFEWIVAENGALLYSPASGEMRLLAESVPAGFAEALRGRRIPEVSVGRAIVATWRPHEREVLQTLAEMKISRQIIYNKHAVMVLPEGVDKASGLMAALKVIKIPARNVVAVGDAENDLPMLEQCGCGVAVSNALDSVKTKADVVTTADHGAGVEELINHLLDDDLASLASPGGWHKKLLRSRSDDRWADS
jgi:HAD superfamily hydrolase (TIGR01484 family)